MMLRARPLIGAAARTYVSRAHYRPVPSYPIAEAIDKVLEGVEERKVKRQARWDKYGTKIAARKGLTIEGPFRNQDETIELALNLNLDPRKPGQALRGSVGLPHGSGKANRVAVFSSDEDIAKAAKEQGAAAAGGEDLIQDIQSGTVPLNFDRSVATPEMMSSLSSVARLLGPRGLMPSAKIGTIQPTRDTVLAALEEQMGGQVQYRTDKAGIVHAGIAKGSFGRQRILDNVQTFMNALQDVKPESFGKGKKGKKGKKAGGAKNAKYYLKAHVCSSQGEGVLVDLRTLDPTSTFFMSEVEET